MIHKGHFNIHNIQIILMILYRYPLCNIMIEANKLIFPSPKYPPQQQSAHKIYTVYLISLRIILFTCPQLHPCLKVASAQLSYLLGLSLKHQYKLLVHSKSKLLGLPSKFKHRRFRNRHKSDPLIKDHRRNW